MDYSELTDEDKETLRAAGELALESFMSDFEDGDITEEMARQKAANQVETMINTQYPDMEEGEVAVALLDLGFDAQETGNAVSVDGDDEEGDGEDSEEESEEPEESEVPDVGIITESTNESVFQKDWVNMSYDEKAELLPAALMELVADEGMVDMLLGSRFEMDIDIHKGLGAMLLFDNDRSTRIIRMITDTKSDAKGKSIPVLGEDISSSANIEAQTTRQGVGRSDLVRCLRDLLEPQIADSTRRHRALQHLELLTGVQAAMKNLSDVFGFDDPRELEAFFAAWLMKNSTCRLSGIPGTGKTTVINCAAILLANSYGFSDYPRWAPRIKYERVPDLKTGITTKNVSVPDMKKSFHLFPKGQSFDVIFSSSEYESTLKAWDDWRFNVWSPASRFSGSYLYDMRFLSRTRQASTTPGGPPKTKMDRETFARMLLMYHRPIFSKTDVQDDHAKERIMRSNIAPVCFTIDAAGIVEIEPCKTMVDLDSEDEHALDTAAYFADRKEDPQIYADKISPDIGAAMYQWVLDHDVHSEELRIQDADGEYTGELQPLRLCSDTGLNDGFLLREILLEFFYDQRVSDDGNGNFSGHQLELLRSEMLRETGIAKIDNDKRADEILYGMEIQQISESREGKDVQTFVFDPIPRPIVTQPIKFFNEANRSQAGVEDAVLGLIAEKEVEYRGKTFNSPSFVAWMDTNPHQKANDLAFTDRIDTELFFGTMSLGKRNAQLQSRYTGAKSLKPDIQLIVRMIDGVCGTLRVGQLGLDDSNSDKPSIWSFVENMPFQPPGVTTGYDGLRDIATLSVLFTQKPQLRTSPDDTTDAIQYEMAGGSVFIDYESANPHAGPLEDISRSSVEQIIEGQEQGNVIHADEEGFQPQSLLKRVLGFRFTDSIVKMSRALAFLRGKEFVGRREIVDSLPFCLGHRLGRARAEGDQEPTGIDQDKVPSEQQFVRQVIVHGYLLRDANAGTAANDGEVSEGIGNNYNRVPAFDVWDAYFVYCEQQLASAISYAEFEEGVLRALKTQYMAGEDARNQLSTVHWHLATAVVEREREGITNMHPSHYTEVVTDGARAEGNAVYADVLDHYRKLISRPEKHGESTPIALTHDFAGIDYFKVRGRIASDRFLFTDDKAHLLDLVDSRINQLCGQPLAGQRNTISNPAGAANLSQGIEPYAAGRQWSGYGLDPRYFPWRSYGDASGGWGIVIGGNRDVALTDPANIDAEASTSQDSISALADQSKRILVQAVRNTVEGDDKRMKKSEQEVRFRKHQLPALTRLFAPVTDNGVIFSHNGSGPHILGSPDEEGVSPDLPSIGFADQLLERDLSGGEPCTITVLNKVIEGFMSNRLNGTGDEDQGAKAVLGDSGILACFPLEHCLGAGSGNIPQVFRELMDNTENMFGKLRLWVRFSEVGDRSSTAESLTFQLCMGITSDFAQFGEEEVSSMDDDGTTTIKTKQTMTYLAVDDADNYKSTAFRYGDDRICWDSGNLTKEDGIFYDKLFSQALDTRVGAIETV